MRVAVRYFEHPGMSGIKRYSLELLQGLRRHGVEAEGNHIFHRELRILGRPVGGLVTMTIGHYLPILGYDVVHSTHYNCQPRRGPCDVVTIHDVMPSTRPELYGLDGKGKAHHDREVRRALRRSWVVTDTEASRREIVETFEGDPDRIEAIHLAVDHARFHPEPAARAMGPLTPGRLTVAVFMNPEWRKRVDLVARAALRLPFVEVVHVGTDRFMPGHAGAFERNRAAIDELARQGRYRHVGGLDDAALRELLCRADVFVHPSMAEGFSLPPLEALACGARVLVSDIPPHREVLGDAARYVALGEDELVAALEDLWDGQAVRDGRFAPLESRLRHARSFTWDRTVLSTLDAYRRAVE